MVLSALYHRVFLFLLHSQSPFAFSSNILSPFHSLAILTFSHISLFLSSFSLRLCSYSGCYAVASHFFSMVDFFFHFCNIECGQVCARIQANHCVYLYFILFLFLPSALHRVYIYTVRERSAHAHRVPGSTHSTTHNTACTQFHGEILN